MLLASLLGPPRWGWQGPRRRLTQGCGRLVSLADLHPGLAQERPFGTGRKKRVDLDAVKTFAATSPCWFQCHQKTTMEQKRQNRNRPVFTYPVLP